MTAQLSRERLEEIKEFGLARIIKPISDDEILTLIDIALAGLDSNPVAYMIGGHYLMHAADPKVDNYASAVPLYAAPPAPVAVPDGLKRAVEFYEQVKRENTPVETGAWKDAVDWVLKEACRAAMLKAEPVTVKFPKCGGTGLADSGGVQPWGEPISIPCDCTITAAPEQE